MEVRFDEGIVINKTRISKTDFERVINHYKRKDGSFIYDSAKNEGIIKVTDDNGAEFLFFYGKDKNTGIEYAYVGKEGESAKFVTKVVLPAIEEKTDEKGKVSYETDGIWKVYTTNSTKIDVEIVDKQATLDHKKYDEAIELKDLTVEGIERTKTNLKGYEAAQNVYAQELADIAKATEDKTNKEAEISALTATIDEDNRVVGVITGKISAKNAEIEKNNGFIKTSTSNLAGFNANLNNVRNELQPLVDAKAAKILTGEEVTAEEEAKINELEAKIVDLENKITTLNTNIEGFNNKAEELNKELDALNTEFNNANKQVADDTQAKADAEEALADLNVYLAEHTEEKAKETLDNTVSSLDLESDYAKRYLNDKTEEKAIDTYFDADIATLDKNIERSYNKSVKHEIVVAQAKQKSLNAQPKYDALYHVLNGASPIRYKNTVRTKDGKIGAVIVFPVVGLVGQNDAHTMATKDLCAYYIEGKTAEEIENALPEKAEEIQAMGGKVCKALHFNEDYTKLAIQVHDQTVIGEDKNIKGSAKSDIEVSIVADDAAKETGDITAAEAKDMGDGIYNALAAVKADKKTGVVVRKDGNGDNVVRNDYDAYFQAKKDKDAEAARVTGLEASVAGLEASVAAYEEKEKAENAKWGKRHPILKKVMLIGAPVLVIATVATIAYFGNKCWGWNWFGNTTTVNMEEDNTPSDKTEIERNNLLLGVEYKKAIEYGASQQEKVTKNNITKKNILTDSNGDPLYKLADSTGVKTYQQEGRKDASNKGEDVEYGNNDVYRGLTELGYVAQDVHNFYAVASNAKHPTLLDGKLEEKYLDNVAEQFVKSLETEGATLFVDGFGVNNNGATIKNMIDYAKEVIIEYAYVGAKEFANDQSSTSSEIQTTDKDIITAFNKAANQAQGFYDTVYIGKTAIYAHDKDSDTLARVSLVKTEAKEAVAATKDTAAVEATPATYYEGKAEILAYLNNGATVTEFMNMNNNKFFKEATDVQNVYCVKNPTVDENGIRTYETVEVENRVNDNAKIFKYYAKGKNKVGTTGNARFVSNEVTQAASVVSSSLFKLGQSENHYTMTVTIAPEVTEITSKEVVAAGASKTGKVLPTAKEIAEQTAEQTAEENVKQ